MSCSSGCHGNADIIQLAFISYSFTHLFNDASRSVTRRSRHSSSWRHTSQLVLNCWLLIHVTCSSVHVSYRMYSPKQDKRLPVAFSVTWLPLGYSLLHFELMRATWIPVHDRWKAIRDAQMYDILINNSNRYSILLGLTDRLRVQVQP